MPGFLIGHSAWLSRSLPKSCSFCHPGPLHKISLQSIDNYLSSVANRQTERWTSQPCRNITSLPNTHFLLKLSDSMWMCMLLDMLVFRNFNLTRLKFVTCSPISCCFTLIMDRTAYSNRYSYRNRLIPMIGTSTPEWNHPHIHSCSNRLFMCAIGSLCVDMQFVSVCIMVCAAELITLHMYQVSAWATVDPNM